MLRHNEFWSFKHLRHAFDNQGVQFKYYSLDNFVNNLALLHELSKQPFDSVLILLGEKTNAKGYNIAYLLVHPSDQQLVHLVFVWAYVDRQLSNQDAWLVVSLE